jgi:hypothetical protein
VRKYVKYLSFSLRSEISLNTKEAANLAFAATFNKKKLFYKLYKNYPGNFKIKGSAT